MSTEELLHSWFIQLSDMIGGPLEPDATLLEGLEWFGSLDDAELIQIQNLGRDNPSIAEFLALGKQLVKNSQS